PLVDRVESLKNVTFHKELGSYYEKSSHNGAVQYKLQQVLKSKNFSACNYAALELVCQFAKADLTTELVKEFTELQGIIGGLYVRVQGLKSLNLSAETIESVAQAIYDRYTPASIEDPIPLTIEGQLFGIADRIQTIIAMFS